MKLSYDPNGNIKTLNRFGVVKTGNAGVTTAMDNLTYTYQSGSNKLTHVDDAIDAKNFDNDIDDQTPNNYTYDAIGNLISDNAEDIQKITWNVYGKMTSVVNTKKERSLNFYYDAAGNRVKKIDGKDKATYYVRDAQGNVMAVYAQEKNKDITAESFYIYGSSRVGELDTSINMRTATVSTFSFSRMRGIKRYEMSNHLGNVMVVVSDRKVYDGNVFKADLVSTTDYYAFGMVMSDRSWNTEGYRFGFNGKENDNEVKGTGNQQDYGMRIYDGRLCKFLSVDPITDEYPELTPYQFASNTPIQATDLDGLEADFTPGKVAKWEFASDDKWYHSSGKFIGNIGVAFWNGIVSTAETAVNNNAIAYAIDGKDIITQQTEEGVDNAKTAYNWTVNTSGDEKLKDIKKVVTNPHTAEDVIAILVTRKLSKMVGGRKPASPTPSIKSTGLKGISSKAASAVRGGANSLKPEGGYLAGKKHGLKWKEGHARAKATGDPQGQWGSKADLEFAGQKAYGLKKGVFEDFELPKNHNSVVHFPDGTTKAATHIRVSNNGTGTFHGYPIIK